MSADSSWRLSGWLAWRGLRAHPGENLLRLVAITVAVVVLMVGCALQPTALARSEHTANHLLPIVTDSRTEGLQVRKDDDWYVDEAITLITVAAVGKAPKTYDGVPLPQPGELVVSPAMADLLVSDPTLRARYPDRIVAELPESSLLGPGSLVVWRYDDRIVAEDGGWLGTPADRHVDEGIATYVPDEISYALPLLVIGFLLPLFALVVLITTLGAARRERRLAALRLVGLTDRQAKLAVAMEDGFVTVAGELVGCLLFWASVPWVAQRLPVEGGVWAADVAVAMPATPILLLLLPVVAVAAGMVGLRTLRTSPLGVERGSAVRVPRWRRAIPLVVGLAMVAVVLARLLPGAAVEAPVLMVASVLVMVGLAGAMAPAVRELSARIAPRSDSLAGLIASRRVLADPVRATRVTVGMTLMLTIAGPLLVFLPLIADVATPSLARLSADLGPTTLTATVNPGTPTPATGEGVAASARIDRLFVQGADESVWPIVAVDCDQLAAVSRVSAAHCRRGLAATGSRAPTGRVRPVRESVDEEAGTVGWIPDGSAFDLPQQPVSSSTFTRLEAVLGTGSVLLVDRTVLPAGTEAHTGATLLAVPEPGASEQARTTILHATGETSSTLGEQHAIASRTTRDLRIVAGLAAVLIIAVAASATFLTAYEQVRGSLAERRLLTIAGAPRRLLRRALVLQVSAPVVLGVVPAVLVSLLLALGFARLISHTTIPLPIGPLLTAALIALIAPFVATALVLRITDDPVTATGEQE